MKAFIEIELFAQDLAQLNRFCTNITNEVLPGLGNMVFGGMPSSGWAAEITGTDPKYKYQRSFLKRKKEYSRGNSKGSRGIYAEYILETGRLYEVKEQKSWSRFERYFCKVNDDGEVLKIDETEVIEWLKSRSALMS